MTDIKDKLDQVTKIGQEIDRGKPSADELLREARERIINGNDGRHDLNIDLLKRIDAHLASQPDSVVADAETTKRIDAAAKGGVVIAEYPAHISEPDSVVVPVEPTEAMRIAGATAIQELYRGDGGWCGVKAAEEQVNLTWSAMLRAAKEPK
jgi:malate synthase